MPENDKTNQIRRKKKLVRAASMLLVIGLVIGLNLYFTDRDYHIDVSEGQIYSLLENIGLQISANYTNI